MKTTFVVLCKAVGRKAGIHNTLYLNGKFKELMCCYTTALNYCVMETMFVVMSKG